MLERNLKRYSAYFRGWCQAFGEHKSIPGEESGINWLVSEHQAGFILPYALNKQLFREVLLHREPPPLKFTQKSVRIGSLEFELASHQEEHIRDVVKNVLTSGDEFHVYLTSHLMYGTDARIITLSTRKPLSIIYKEIGTLRIQLI